MGNSNFKNLLYSMIIFTLVFSLTFPVNAGSVESPVPQEPNQTLNKAQGDSLAKPLTENLGGVIDVRATSHTCVLTTAGGVRCWGDNYSGELGDGTVINRFVPVDVIGLTRGVSAISIGGSFSCALTKTGGVKCWGGNRRGALGDGTTTDRLTPVDVVGLTSGVIAISAGETHTCALTNTKGVKCWGNNGDGQLGDGTTIDRLTPVDVVGLTNGVEAISAGAYHTCALTSTGGVKCWGRNTYGALGDSTTTDRLTPVDVVGLSSGVMAISAGGMHTCALTSTGGVKCWGDNWRGALGDGTTTDRLTPVDVVGLSSSITAITAGNNYTCALTETGGAKCWGINWNGELGNGEFLYYYSMVEYESIPQDVVGLSSGVAAISAGTSHTCAVINDGGVKCWGDNSWGQLGLGIGNNIDSSLTPLYVTNLSNGAVDAVTSSNHTCALTEAGDVKCWGNNNNGQLGDNTATAKFIPVDVVDLLPDNVAVSTGTSHTCSLTEHGTVKCWGSNWSGQLGDGSGSNSYIPVGVLEVSGESYIELTGVEAISSRSNHNCVLTGIGGIKCWGDNGEGQLGNGMTSDSWTAIDVPGLTSGMLAVSSGLMHTCALTNTGGVKCWGNNSYGQLGDGTTVGRLTPMDVTGLTSGIIAISAGSYHTCALTNTGGVKCWGTNEKGELGDGTTIDRLTPVDVIGLSSGVSAISATGEYHTCALTESGGVKCWGENGYGQLGTNSTTDSYTPVDVIGLTSGILSITTGFMHSCAVDNSGGVLCWGYNYYGQLGNGTAGHSSVPLDVVAPPPVILPLSGRVTTAAGIPVDGVTISDDFGHVTTTNSEGEYTFPDMVSGLYTITASKAGITFYPESLSVDLYISTQTGNDFVALPIPTYVDLTISLYKTASPEERSAYEEILKYFGDAIYEVSNGAHKIRNITIYQDGSNQGTADIIWNASEWPRANVSGRGDVGAHVWMGDEFPFDIPYTVLNSENYRSAGYALAHEWGHYYYGLFDEYKANRLDLVNETNPATPHYFDIEVQNSVMTNQWMAAESGNYAWLNFSVVPDAKAGKYHTAQDRMYGASGWDTLIRASDPPFPQGDLYTIAYLTRTYYPELVDVSPLTNTRPGQELQSIPGEYAHSEVNVEWIEVGLKALRSEGGGGYTTFVKSLSGTSIASPSPLVITAQVNNSVPLTDVEVAATFTAPDSSTGSLELFDDGQPPDVLASDGIYSGILPYTQDGDYVVDVAFNNDAGNALLTELAAAHAIGPNGETWVPELIPVSDPFNSSASLTVTVTGVLPDDHGDTPGTATALATDNVGIWGRMDRAGDVDAFRVTPTADGIVSIRLTNLGLGFKPHVDILAADGVTILSTYDFEPNNLIYFNAQVSGQSGVPFYVAVTHTEGAAAGFYMISAGEMLPSDQQMHTIFVPLIH